VLSVVSPFRYIRAAYAKTPLIAEADLPQNINRLNFAFDGVLRLIGYRVEQSAVRPGEWLPVTLYWQAVRPIDENYSAFVHVLDQNGASIAQANTYPAGGNWPTSLLEPGLALPDTYHIFVPPDVDAPAATRLAMGIFEFEDPTRAAKPAVDAGGNVVEPIVEGIPLVPHRWPELDPAQPLLANFGDQIRLIGYDWIDKNKEIAPGATAPLTLYWETLQPPGQNLNLFIHLIDPAAHSQVAGFDAPPQYPTGYWQPGNTIVDSRTLAFPADLPSGSYELRIGWYNLDDFARLPLAGDNGPGDALTLFAVEVAEE
jgi:hypothetical protein